MIDLVTITVATLTFILVYFGAKLIKKNNEYLERPPCLFHLPIVGSLPFLPRPQKLHKYFLHESKEIGNIFAIYLCNRYAIVLNGKEIIKDALVKCSLAFADRPDQYLAKFFNEDNKGIMRRHYDEDFKKLHRLTLNIFKSFGFGQGIMETRIRVEVDNLMERFSMKNGESFDPKYEITASVSNVICSIIFGKRENPDDQEFHEGLENIHALIGEGEKKTMINFLPILRFMPIFNNLINKQLKTRQQIKSYIKSALTKATEIDVEKSFYETLKKDIENEKMGVVNEEVEENLLLTIRDFFVAGTETTATTLLWFIIFMANHQDIQDQIRREIDQAVDKDRHPSLDDKPNLPILESTLLEVMRIKTLVPMSLPHSTLKDTYLKGMFIPAKTMVFVNLYSCHMDPDVWPEPEKFCINRFLDDTKSKVINKDQVVSFSLGKRSCLGEILARQELFLFASALVHEFEILPAEGENFIEVVECVNVSNSPSAFKARFIKR